MTSATGHDAEDTARVLLAEDDADFRALLAAELRRAGYEVDEASDGRELVQMLGTIMLTQYRKPAVIVTDICMPGASGMEVAEALSRVRSKIPIVLMTAFGDAETHAHAAQLGARVVLDKPFTVSLLCDVLARTISGRVT